MSKFKIRPQDDPYKGKLDDLQWNLNQQTTASQRRFLEMLQETTNDESVASLCRRSVNTRSSYAQWIDHFSRPRLSSEPTRPDEVVH